MEKFNELIYLFDRTFIKNKIKNELNTIEIHGSKIKPIDILITFARRIKYEYVHNIDNWGLCRAKTDAMYYMNKKHRSCDSWKLSSNTLESFMSGLYKDYAGHYPEWLIGREQGYWWHVYYPYPSRYRKKYNGQRVRLAAPRIRYMDWLINILIAYKNEYNNI